MPEIVKQCYHHNRGYCKHGEKCRLPHYKQICKSNLCREKTCLSRHPKPCKYEEACKFLKVKKCAYKHETIEKNQEMVSEYENIIEKLKAEVFILTNNIKLKETELNKELNDKKGKETSLKNLLEEIKNLKIQNLLYETENKELKDETSKQNDKKFDEITFSCDLCDKEHLNKNDFQQHVLYIHGQASAKSKETIKELNERIYNLVMETKKDKPEIIARNDKNLIQTCKLCGKFFNNEGNLKEHLKINHAFSCDQCDRQFESYMHLYNHITVKHHSRQNDLDLTKENETLHQCNICLKSFENERDLSAHISYHCQKCQQYLPDWDLNSVKNHQKTCENSRLYFWHFKDGRLIKMANRVE